MATSTNPSSVDVAVTSEQVVASEPPLTAESSETSDPVVASEPPLTAESSETSEKVVASEQPLMAESSETSEKVVASEQPLTAEFSETSEPAETFDSAISKPAVILISHDSEKEDAAELENSIEACSGLVESILQASEGLSDESLQEVLLPLNVLYDELRTLVENVDVGSHKKLTLSIDHALTASDVSMLKNEITSLKTSTDAAKSQERITTYTEDHESVKHHVSLQWMHSLHVQSV